MRTSAPPTTNPQVEAQVRCLALLRRHLRDLQTALAPLDHQLPRLADLLHRTAEAEVAAEAAAEQESDADAGGDRALLKRAYLLTRRAQVEDIERQRQKTHHPDLLSALDAEQQALDALAEAPWFAETPATPLPRREDLLRPATRHGGQVPGPPLPRPYDPLFGLVLDASRFAPDLAFFGAEADARGVPVSVASLDMDDLRAVNDRYGETTVTRALLPRFLTTLEARVFGRGQVYGFGRDDHAVLLPGADAEDAIRILQAVQADARRLDCPPLSACPTLSVGVIVQMPESLLTPHEVWGCLQIARETAKAAGKDCICLQTLPSGALHTTAPHIIHFAHP